MKKMKRLFAMLLCSVMLLSVMISGTATSASARELSFYDAGGAAATSSIFAIVVAWAELVNSQSNYIELIVQATAGSNAHYNLLHINAIQIGSGSMSSNAVAFRGETDTFPQPLTSHRIIATPVVTFQSIVVRADSGIYSINDLNGRTVNVGNAGSPSSETAVGTIRALGIDANIVFSTNTEAIEQYQEGRIDAFMWTAGPGNSVIMQALDAAPSRLISLSEEEALAVASSAELSGRTAHGFTYLRYWGLEPADQTVRHMTNTSDILVRYDMPDADVVEMLEIFWNNIDDLRDALAAINGVPESIIDATSPVHPAAARFYREVFNIEVPAHLLID